jgi:hypothetical protein
MENMTIRRIRYGGCQFPGFTVRLAVLDSRIFYPFQISEGFKRYA